MEIATNAVIAALLVQAGGFVKDTGLPLSTPLEPSRIQAFRWSAGWARDGDQEIECYMRYEGGYVFRLSKGRIDSFETPNAYSMVQAPADLEGLLGEPRFTQSECLAKAREVIRRLGYTNVALIEAQPRVEIPRYVGSAGRRIPRFIFGWPQKGSTRAMDAEVEINSSSLQVEFLNLPGSAFWRTPWPLNFGMTNQPARPPPQTPKRAELEVKDVSRQYAMDFIRAILPQISDFCSKLGLPIPSQIQQSDISMGESYVAIKRGRLSASLRLKSGYLVIFHAGHVWAVHSPDAFYNSPSLDPKVRESAEWSQPTRFSGPQLAEKVRQLLLNQLHLPENELFLNTPPVFTLVANPDATNGVRRFAFDWQRPTPPGKHMGLDAQTEISVSAEVDAVSGNIKAINFLHRSLEKPDPNVVTTKE